MGRRKAQFVRGPARDWLKQRGGLGNQYKARDRTLRKMGFTSYKGYLASGLWQRIRQQVLERDKHKCHCCLGEAEIVHHHLYNFEQLSGRSLKGLYSLCRYCHRKIEFEGNGTKRVSAERIHERMESLRLDFEYERKHGLNSKPAPPAEF